MDISGYLFEELDTSTQRPATATGPSTLVTNSAPTSVNDSGYASPQARASGKRLADDADLDEDDQDVQKKVKMFSTRAKVPVDEEYMVAGGAVHADSDGVAYDATLNQTDSSNNHNKFYRLQLVEHSNGTFTCWTRWGRVGERGQNKVLGDGSLDNAIVQFEKKFKDKTGHTWANRDDPPKNKKYTLIEMKYEAADAAEQDNEDHHGSNVSNPESTATQIKSTLPPSVENLMHFIFDNKHVETALAELEYDAVKMPLGNLSQNTLRRGYQVLKDLTSLLQPAGSNAGAQVKQLSNQYYTLVPHDFGRHAPPILDDLAAIKKEITLLENLTDLRVSNEIMQHARASRLAKQALADRQFEGLGMESMTPIAPTSSEYQELKDYLIKSSGQTHAIKYRVEDIFRIERKGEHARFESEFSSLSKDRSNRALLWHGSRSTNFPGILSQGLRIAPPEAPVSGYMFGKGIYLANMSTKSANYCCSWSSGETGLLLLCEAELGTPPYRLMHASYTAEEESRNAGCLSTWGVGATTIKGWKDAECVHPDLKGVVMPDVTELPGPSGEYGVTLMYDEFIAYSVAQVRLRYLLRVKM